MKFIIDPGHGGMLYGKNLTDPRYGKFFDHGGGDIAYEGETNRKIASNVISIATKLGIETINLCPTELDVPLSVRVEIANRYSNLYGISNVMGISIHSNASEAHNARGFEIWTSPGQNKSDDYAKIFVNRFLKEFPDINVRSDYSDGDPDKESLFYILRYTHSPWILPEFLFFDNKKDWELLKQPAVQARYAKVIVDTMIQINNGS